MAKTIKKPVTPESFIAVCYGLKDVQTAGDVDDNLEQYNSASLAVGEYKVYGIVCCRDNSQHYRRAYFSASSRAERVVCDKRHISMTSA